MYRLVCGSAREGADLSTTARRMNWPVCSWSARNGVAADATAPDGFAARLAPLLEIVVQPFRSSATGRTCRVDPEVTEVHSPGAGPTQYLRE